MDSHQQAEACLRGGDVASAIVHLEKDIRSRPDDARLRIFLFQLLAVRGEWDRARDQLAIAAALDESMLSLAATYGDLLDAERARVDVFAGRCEPSMLSSPESWVSWLIESVRLAGCGDHEGATTTRDRAFEAAPTRPGAINDTRFTWIADADSRLGPVLEVIVRGRYTWVPFSDIATLAIERPGDLRDLVWAPARLGLAGQNEITAFVPSRYPGSERHSEPAVTLGRKTVWEQTSPGVYAGFGQRMLATAEDDWPLLEVRTLALDACSQRQRDLATARG